MNAFESKYSPANPFATRSIRPGALRFRFSNGASADELVAKLQASGWWGEITGQHGCGKSTLLATLTPLLKSAGREPLTVSLHDGERSLPAELNAWRAWTSATQIIVDGYEQLSRWSRWRLARRCRRQRCGLLVTAHAPVGFPPLAHVNCDLPTAQAIVAELLSAHAAPINADDVAAAFHTRNGNVRDTLFDLYDLYERRR